MGTEIERKFLLPSFPAAELAGGVIRQIAQQTIYQTYLAYSADQEIRVRQIVDEHGGSTYTHTFKSGHGLIRQEIEYEISEELYRQLLGRTKLIPLEKVRTKVEQEGRLFEIDEYKQAALTVVEAEFADETAAREFVIPGWFGRELGQEDEFRNKTLWLRLQTGG